MTDSLELGQEHVARARRAMKGPGYIASNLSMRLHGVHSFNAYPYVIRCGGMLNAFGPELGRKTTHPETGDTTLACNGFNDKSDYDRRTPCDKDYLRKRRDLRVFSRNR